MLSWIYPVAILVQNIVYEKEHRLKEVQNKIYLIHLYRIVKVKKGAKIRDLYNLVPHLTQNTDGKVTNAQ